ncbi:hypothetical protein ABB37_02422 [Leptomonas pyrrhocoris]|uniref:Uncharacterized protein n=1 Tax=Leptomonas pyrrhocoris TaxID=157538 RepID=A0A0M9G801_LEPPY|nr:hypothetical protein ABB37_02422 [Leptomonas pyrrhocoris]XP_015662902.1 hypothetical protein ABB37_02422 [Leptomonas pyrrhocoris]KPA84462.1 hypothetical protein ABB37_02422 [Leptomonas pyrrhocoris]KPA84463.1 hypothetical protein ABB37_02422 [Leptomonas pyrrhocoris]|eukprot:XP_015662901.1 hypothetical protein ABB37_02422 [Leptomonas pyrrhocoris]
MISDARSRRQRQLRQAIKMALAARSSEPPLTKRDDRYAKNRQLAVAELEKVENEKARAALKARGVAAASQAERKQSDTTTARQAKKKIEREVRKARTAAAEQAAEARFAAELQRLQEKRDARTQALREKHNRASKSAAAESMNMQEELKAAVEVSAKEEKEKESTTVLSSAKPAKPARRPAAKKVKAIASEATQRAAEPLVVPDAQEEAPVPVAPPPPAATTKPVVQRPPSRLQPPPAAVAAIEDVSEVHDEFVAQLEKAKGRATAVPTQTAIATPAKTPAAPTKSWAMPESSTGLFRL